ncbi:MAG: V-type ATPase, subunit [Mahella sp.]|nr:V-type ATPase, subunit [Mahella sp.]
MPQMNVNPTRMELTRLKSQLATAVRGHDLMKDKRDELMRRFMDLIRKNKELREKVEAELTEALHSVLLARAVMSREMLEEAVMYPTRRMDINIEMVNLMSVEVPSIKYKEDDSADVSMYPYGFANTSGELDSAIARLHEILPDMLELAQVEKTCQRLADEIERTRRRVNALEYIMIPQLEETIRYITMKLDENERSTLTRLMKVKEMLQERNL